MTYRIDRSNGESRTASSMSGALRIARQMVGSQRVYRGAEYTTDRPSDDGRNDRVIVEALDIWRTKSAAQQQNGACADVVISWDAPAYMGGVA